MRLPRGVRGSTAPELCEGEAAIILHLTLKEFQQEICSWQIIGTVKVILWSCLLNIKEKTIMMISFLCAVSREGAAVRYL